MYILDELLGKYKLDPNHREPISGRTALHYADDLDVVVLLMRYGATCWLDDSWLMPYDGKPRAYYFTMKRIETSLRSTVHLRAHLPVDVLKHLLTFLCD